MASRGGLAGADARAAVRNLLPDQPRQRISLLSILIGTMQFTPKHYAMVLIATGFVLSAAVVAANVLIDPQDVFGAGLIREKRNVNQRYHRYIDYQRSASKVEGLFFSSSLAPGIPLSHSSLRTEL